MLQQVGKPISMKGSWKKEKYVLFWIYGQHKLDVRYDKLSLICMGKAPVEFISFFVWKFKACLNYALFGESGFPQENSSEQGNYDDSQQ